ncbi:MAG: cation diffusion facilitator family transporter [Gammaproteobacteria bacterium]
MSASSTKVIYAALIGNFLIACIKFIAASITGSSAMLSEGIHSVVDTGNQILLLYGLKRAKRPADKRFPFGHGKEVYFWSFVVAILIFAVGAGVSIYEGVHRILNPSVIENITVNYIVLALAFVFEGAAWLFALREFKLQKGKWGYLEAVHRGKDPSIFLVLFEDSAAMSGLLVAFIGVFLTQVTGILIFDGIASVLIGIILAITAMWLAYETKGLLIGESANADVVSKIEELAKEHHAIEYVNEILTMHMGPDYILVNLSVNFMDAAVADDIELAIDSLDKEIKAVFPKVKRIFIEAERRH